MGALFTNRKTIICSICTKRGSVIIFSSNIPFQVNTCFIFRTYRCRKSKLSHTGCLARLNQTGDSYRMTGEHNHPSEEEEIRRLAVRTECKEQAATQPERPKAIFESVRQRYYF